MYRCALKNDVFVKRISDTSFFKEHTTVFQSSEEREDIQQHNPLCALVASHHQTLCRRHHARWCVRRKRKQKKGARSAVFARRGELRDVGQHSRGVDSARETDGRRCRSRIATVFLFVVVVAKDDDGCIIVDKASASARTPDEFVVGRGKGAKQQQQQRL